MSLTSREAKFDALAADVNVDVLVIGGGINGISVWRELALEGLRTVLAEQGDFCSGASSALSRMVHGGLRYLESGELKLVRESLEERDRLLDNAPHYVAPLPTTIPLASLLSGLLNAACNFPGLRFKPSPRGALVVKAGLSIYDILTASRRRMPRHRMSSYSAMRSRWPDLDPATRWLATYHDAWISYPERLAVEIIRDTGRAGVGAIALNHVSVTRGGDRGLALHDELGGRQIPVAPKFIVNATGAWVDRTNRLLSGGTSAPAPLIGGTKGSHLVIRNDRLHRELDGEMIYYENQEGRVCILLPYFGNVLVGSTDIRVDSPDGVRCEDDEKDYILRSVAHVFPGIDVRESEIVFRFSGVRPLPISDSALTGQISRDHQNRFVEVAPDLPPVLCMIGGKWTTFRAFGEQAADLLLERFGRKRLVDTRRMPIGGGRDYPMTETARNDLVDRIAVRAHCGREQAVTLLQRYGTTALEVAGHIAGGSDTPLDGAPDFTIRELEWLIHEESVELLDDLLLRRTNLAISGSLTLAVLDAALNLLAGARAWTEALQLEERARVLALLQARHGLSEETLAARDTGGADG